MTMGVLGHKDDSKTTLSTIKDEEGERPESSSSVESSYGAIDQLEDQLIGAFSSADSGYNTKVLEQMIAGFQQQYTEALNMSLISMIPSFNYICDLSENGRYLSLDLGGSTFRVSVIDINPTKVLMSHKFNITDDNKCIDYKFFDFIGDKISESLSEGYFQSGETIKTGITWSFPISQTNINDGKVTRCGKGYTLDPAICERSLKELFEDCVKRHNLRISVKSIVNDSIAVYLTSKFFNSNTAMGIVLGTGTNCCMFLPTKLITDSKKVQVNANVLQVNNHEECLFNTELSFFGEHLKQYGIISKWDEIIHNDWSTESVMRGAYINNNDNSGKLFQPLEMLTSGRFISELARLIIVDYYEAGVILQTVTQFKKEFFVPHDYFTGTVCCAISNSADDVEGLEKSKHFFEQNFVESGVVSVSDIMNIKRIIRLVAVRAAATLSCSIVALQRVCQKEDLNTVNFGYGGSVLNHFNYYREKVLEILQLLQPGSDITLEFVADSSIYGAAICAAINDK